MRIRVFVSVQKSRRLKPGLLVLLTWALVACALPTETPRSVGALQEREVDLSGYFAGINPDDATFVVYHPASARITRHNPERAQLRFLPASTYKIPNSLIALDTGVADGPDHLIQWDSTVPRESGFWSPTWSKDHTLRSAIRTSAYWYYQELAREIGVERMQSYLEQFDYGNQSMAGGIDKFWLHSGGLRISPDEQVKFLHRMYSGKLGVSEHATRVLKNIIVLEDKPDYRISGKTGTADVTPTRELAWLVGYVERDGDVWFYALNMEGEQVWEQWGRPDARLALVRAMLHELNVLPRNG
jgi:beta-lactamase class D